MRSAGYDVGPSQDGIYVEHMVRLWGSLDAVAVDLRNGGLRRVLLRFLEVEAPCITGKEVSLGERRYLSFRGIVSHSRLSAASVGAVIDRYCERGILRRGFALKCPVCNHAEWQRAEDVGQSYQCSRCSSRNTVTLPTWREPRDGPAWYFGLNELVFRALSQNAHVPVLALDTMRDGAQSFQFSPQLDVLKSGKKVTDIDICAIVDGQIVVGEAKIRNLLDPRGSELKAVAALHEIGRAAGADRVIFATYSRAWSSKTRTHIQGAFKDARPKARVLAQRDLLREWREIKPGR